MLRVSGRRGLFRGMMFGSWSHLCVSVARVLAYGVFVSRIQELGHSISLWSCSTALLPMLACPVLCVWGMEGRCGVTSITSPNNHDWPTSTSPKQQAFQPSYTLTYSDNEQVGVPQEPPAHPQLRLSPPARPSAPSRAGSWFRIV